MYRESTEFGRELLSKLTKTEIDLLDRTLAQTQNALEIITSKVRRFLMCNDSYNINLLEKVLEPEQGTIIYIIWQKRRQAK